jgi:hypothetical protein
MINMLKYNYIHLAFWVLAVFQFNSSFCQLYINEIFATNCSKDLDLSTYNYINWIEIFNQGSSRVPLWNYYLSDDSLNLKKWKFSTGFAVAANEYFSVFADGENSNYHTNFKLNPDGGYLYLSYSNGTITDKVRYYKQYYDISSGRCQGSNDWKYFSNPTKNKANSEPCYSGPSANTIIIKKGGYYSGTQLIEIKSASQSGDIYYTLDGADPLDTSSKYTGSVEIKKTSVLRARVIEAGKLPGAIETNTYFINERKSQLPVLSLATTPGNLNNAMIGIYIVGMNGIDKFCSNGPANWNQDWERSVNIELFNTSQNRILNQQCGTEIMGGCSRTNALKSMTFTAKSKYGKGMFNYKFFQHKPFHVFNSICIRNSGNDFNNTMLRDAMMQTLTIGRMNFEYQADQPVVIYIEGRYFGLMDIRERSDENLLTSNFGLDESNIDLIELQNSPILGSSEDYNTLINYIRNNDLADQTNYKYVESQMDIDNFINYNIAEIFINNSDWPGNNIKFWRVKNPVTKWRWILYDTDFGFGLYDKDYTFNMLQLALDSVGPGWPNPEWSTIFLRSLLKNNEFKRKFLTRFYAHMSTTFEPGRVIGIIDSMKNVIADEINYAFKRWGSTQENWTYNVEILKEFARQRPYYMRQFLREYFKLDSDINVEHHSNIPQAGKIIIDDVAQTDTFFKGFFPDHSICKIKFKATDGYQFVKAVKTKNSTKFIQVISKNAEWKYFDKGYKPDSLWFTPDYNDSLWLSGRGKFGYGDGNETTTVSYGSNANNKFITTYFRRSFTYDSAKPLRNDTLRILYDDGAVIYLNGHETFKINMPDVAVEYNTLAFGAPDETKYFDFPFDSSLLINGKNVIAVEIHQTAVTSTDISFNLELSGYSGYAIQNFNMNRDFFTDTLKDNITYWTFYEPVKPIANLIINEISPLNRTFADEGGDFDNWVEIFNNSDDKIDMADLFFSDSIDSKRSWKVPSGIPSQTIINPNSYKIFWADNEESEGPLHMNFILNYKGGKLGIYQKIGENINVIDEMVYKEVFGSNTMGRIPNGSGSFKTLKTSSPAASNIDNSDRVESVEAKHEFIRIAYANKQVTITPDIINTGKRALVQIADITGRIIKSEDWNISGTFNFDLKSQKAGIYIIYFITEHNIAAKKVLIE